MRAAVAVWFGACRTKTGRVAAASGVGAVTLAVSLALTAASPVLSQDLVPERRAVLALDTDLPGGDLRTLLDTTLESCERACLSDSSCTTYTFNSRNGSCFPKSAAGAATPYLGAVSGRVVASAPGLAARAAARRGDLGFLKAADFAAALAQARAMGQVYIADNRSPQTLRAEAVAAFGAGDPARARDRIGALVGVGDTADQWAEYARLTLRVLIHRPQDESRIRSGALLASVNAYLRADTPAERHMALAVMADALEATGRGRAMVPALQLAQALQPRDDTASRLDRAIGLYGFRITGNRVESNLASPRVCAEFTEDLVETGLDYTPYVQLPEAGLSVEPGQWRELCVAGLRHGQRYAITFREGLPSAGGQSLAKSVRITAYVRDRAPAARFSGRGYVLPRGAAAAIPVETVNTPRLDLELYRVSDRNLVRALQEDYLGRPMDRWRGREFARQLAEAIWTGSAEVPVETNRDMTTRLPMDEALAGQPAGIYVLKASVPGVDEYETSPAWQWFVVSDLGVTTLSGVDGTHVFVRSLGTAAPRDGVEVALISRANSELARLTTDATGHVRFNPGVARGTGGAEPVMVTVSDGEDDIAFLSLSEPGFDLSDRGVAGREAAPPIDVFVTTDRGAYRAGETVHATALARDSRAAAIEGLPLTARLRRPDGVEYSRALVPDAGAGGHVFAMPIAGNAPRGAWRLDMLADPEAAPLATATFLVEDFLPERIDFDLALPEGALRLDAIAPLTVSARYLFGARGADLAIEGEAILRAASGIAAWPGYRFGRTDAPFSAMMQGIPGGLRTDAAGEAGLDVMLPQPATDPGLPLEARIRLRIAEGSGRPVERDILRPVLAPAPLIGIRPGFEGDSVPEGSEARFGVIAVGPAGAAVDMPVKWRIDRVETRYQWYQLYGSWNWEPVTSRRRVAEGEAMLTATGPVEIAAAVDWGSHELTVERADGTFAAAAMPFSAGWSAPADAAVTPDTLEMSLDKPAYRAGETARLRVVPRHAGTALVSVLSNRLISMQAIEVAAGENLIDLPVTDDWGAGVYVTVSALRPMEAQAGRLPARALGLAHAAIDPGARRLDAQIEAPAEADPRGPLDVAVRVKGAAPGETVHATIAAVDLGILNLTAFSGPDPEGHYFGQRKLGVEIRDLYGRLIDGMNGAEGRVRSGGDAAGARLAAPPPTEDLVAFFSGPLTLDADGLARASFDLPAFNGTVRVMAVVWSRSAVGQATADVLVRDPVVVSASLPRFLSPGDESRLLLEMTHATGAAGRMGLDITADGISLGAVPSGIDLAAGGRATVTVPMRADAVGLAELRVVLTTPEGRRLEKPLRLPVQVNDPETVRVSRFDLAPGQTFTFGADAFAGLRAGSGLATLAAGPIARFDAPGLLAALDRYPYGCSEQITSRALPLLYLDQVARAMDLPGTLDLRDRIAQALREVLLHQTTEGGFGLWSAMGGGDLWLDAYVTDFLSRARAEGHDVPQPAFRAALDNLRNAVNYAGDFEQGGGELAYALMVLAREGAAAIGDLRYYADVKAGDFDTPIALAQLGAALAHYGDVSRADAMFARAMEMVASDDDDGSQTLWRADYGTGLRDAAAVLTLATEAGSARIDRAALTDRIAARPGARALSTQEAAWTLLATHALIDRTEADGLTLDGAPVTGPLVRVLEAQAAVPMALRNEGAASTMVTVSTYGVPEVPEPAGGNGYAISRSYFTSEGEPVDIAQVAAGTRLVAVLEVTPFGDGEARLMVADPLPAGFEIDNPNLLRSGQISGLSWLDLTEDVAHSEFRQDRFLTAVDLRGETGMIRLAYLVRAVSPGSYHHPAPSVEDMYRPAFRATGAAGRVTVTP